LIIIGGGVSNNLMFMEKTIAAVIKKRAMKVQAAMVKIVRAQLGDDAGIIGARVLVKEALGER
jgi:predicted NBD/HSP70 family sugar kinase